MIKTELKRRQNVYLIGSKTTNIANIYIASALNEAKEKKKKQEKEGGNSPNELALVDCMKVAVTEKAKQEKEEKRRSEKEKNCWKEIAAEWNLNHPLT